MRRMRKSLLLASALAAFCALHSAAHSQLRELGTGAPGPLKAPHVTAKLISDSGTIAPGTASRVALSLTLEPGWHVYWLYAGDAGEPPVVMWSLPHGVSAGPMQYPVPSRLPVGPLMDYGYQGTAVFPFDLTASQNLRLGPAKLTAHVQWLVCREICPSRKGISGTQSPRGSEGHG
jgi:thiol:disulfide interchange protein DsbD